MKRLVTKEDIRQAIAAARHEGKRIGFVPTMGALHEGHLSLVRAARERADYVVVSVFVNPTQFGPGEDFEAYPRDIERDMGLLAIESVDLVFTPDPETMYGSGAQVTVDPGPLGTVLEGATRPGHFAGVCTVVTKLFSIVQPDFVFFGEKDYQQLAVIRLLVRDLDLPVGIVGCPTVREDDGLARSSRNAYLSADERAAAPVLYRAMMAVARLASAGERSVRVLADAMRAEITAESLAELDYAVIVDEATLAPLEMLEAAPARVLVAVRIGATRLIDNLALEV